MQVKFQSNWNISNLLSFMPLRALVAMFMGPTWGPSRADRAQVGRMLAPWTLLSGRSRSWNLLVKSISNSLSFVILPNVSRAGAILRSIFWSTPACSIQIARLSYYHLSRFGSVFIFVQIIYSQVAIKAKAKCTICCCNYVAINSAHSFWLHFVNSWGPDDCSCMWVLGVKP